MAHSLYFQESRLGNGVLQTLPAYWSSLWKELALDELGAEGPIASSFCDNQELCICQAFLQKSFNCFPFILQREFSSSLIYSKVERRFESGCRSDTAPDVIAGPEK